MTRKPKSSKKDQNNQDILDHPAARVLLRAAIPLKSWIKIRPIPPEYRPQFEKELDQYLRLAEAYNAGLIKSYRFVYSDEGIIDIKLKFPPHIAALPGMRRLRDLFLREDFL